jgi:hypothetical protein
VISGHRRCAAGSMTGGPPAMASLAAMYSPLAFG